MIIHEHLRNNRLSAAIDAAQDQVRSHPADGDVRSLLGLLYCFDGQLGKADRHLAAAAQQSSELQVGVSLLRQLLRAETMRQDFFFNGAVPELMSEPDAAVESILRAVMAQREGDEEELKEQVQALQQSMPTLRGTVNGNPFDDVRDLDDILSQFLEIVCLDGKYYLVPFKEILNLSLHSPEKLQDQIWRSADINLVGGFQGVVYLPTCYCKSSDDSSISDALKLGGETDWVSSGNDGPVRGVGQKTFLFGENALSTMELGEIEITAGERDVTH